MTYQSQAELEVADTLTRLMTKGLLGGMPVPGGSILADPSLLQHAGDAGGAAADGLASHAMSGGAEIIPGPSEGGALLERPVGSFLAEHAQTQSLGLEQAFSPEGVSYAAKALDGAGQITVDGFNVNVLDYVPGGDFVQMVAGDRFDPSSMLMMLAKGKLESEAIHGHMLGLERGQDPGRPVTGADPSRDGSPTMDQGGHEGASMDPVAGGRSKPNPVTGERMQEAGDLDGANGDAAGATGGVAARRAPDGRQHIDNDTAARDLAILSAEHARNLDNAVEQFDEYDVHTEMKLHGRRIEIDTHYDAHNPDNRKEVETADDHARHIPDAGARESVTEGNKMSFRSQVHAHLEAASKDEGISR